MFHFSHLLVEGVHHVSQHFCLLSPVVNGIHFPPKGVNKADLSEAAITVQNPPVIHVTLNITPLLSRTGLGIDSYDTAEGVTVGRQLQGSGRPRRWLESVAISFLASGFRSSCGRAPCGAGSK